MLEFKRIFKGSIETQTSGPFYSLLLRFWYEKNEQYIQNQPLFLVMYDKLDKKTCFWLQFMKASFFSVCHLLFEAKCVAN